MESVQFCLNNSKIDQKIGNMVKGQYGFKNSHVKVSIEEFQMKLLQHNGNYGNLQMVKNF